MLFYLFPQMTWVIHQASFSDVSLECCHRVLNSIWGYIWNPLSLNCTGWVRRLCTDIRAMSGRYPRGRDQETKGSGSGTCEALTWASVYNPGSRAKEDDNLKTRRCRYWERWYKNQLTTTNTGNNKTKTETSMGLTRYNSSRGSYWARALWCPGFPFGGGSGPLVRSV